MTLIDQIRDLIAEGETERSLDELYSYVKQNNADVIDNLVMLRSRMQNLQRSVLNGTMDDQSAALERAKINDAILKLLPQLTPEYQAEAKRRREFAPPAAAFSGPEPARNNNRIYLIVGGGLLLLILLIFLFGGGDSESSQTAADVTSTSLDVASNQTGQAADAHPGGQAPETQQGQPGQEENLSAEWRSADGSPSWTTEDGVHWTEMENGVAKFTFETKDVTDEYVEIHDASRQMTLRIFDTSVKLQHNGEWNVLANGGWMGE